MSDTPTDYSEPLAAAISSILDIADALEKQRDAVRAQLVEIVRAGDIMADSGDEFESSISMEMYERWLEVTRGIER